MNIHKKTNRPFVLISVMLAMFVGAVEATIVSTAMPAIAAELGGFSRYSWIFSSYLLMSTVTVLIYGKLADLFGRKPIFFIGMSIFLIGSILCGFAYTMEQLIVYRLIQGLGAGAVMPIATTIVGDIYSTKERAKIQGYLSSVWGVSAVSGPVIGGLIVQYMDWKYVFWVNVPLGLLAMAGVFFFLQEPVIERKVAIDFKGAALLATSLSIILFWLVEGGQAFDRTSLLSLFLVVFGIGLFTLFIWTERRAADPMMPFAIWKNPVILYANLVSLTTGGIMIGVSSYLPTFVTGVMEQPAIIAGFTLTAMSIGWPIASSVAGHLLIRFGTFKVSFAGGLSLIIGGMLFVLMTGGSGPLWAAFSSFFIGVGMGLTSTAFIVTIQGAVSREHRGSATAANMFMRNFGNTIGAAIFGAVLNGSLLTIFKKKELDYEVNDINLLLTEEARSTLPVFKMEELQHALDGSLQWVYIAVLVFAVISMLLILRIPRGVVQYDDN
ncbi:MDR family MFS transporter [Sporosarcina thermotolerans]|uniref:MDR family MFS transporter n=1 Tax=Sporosarcina thermotolerans TaxID=633404 RepID=A0AAW9A4S2_9BACL|nr:MDR family MFS transporter [Sporosarcina thermotolerans]MDW0115897.1 MDR family MFS transporter [Sporosarcina thermotolerans]WHT46884.1 MDR family MFS transporter [Sporosarcina thermotolerans]